MRAGPGAARLGGWLLGHRVLVLRGQPGHVAGDFSPGLKRPVDRTAAAFNAAKQRLHDLLFDRAGAAPRPALVRAAS